ncbi:MAG: FABP family protein [Pseudonocardiales bacterium]|nr:MAG: FABP family protein [Pseudonocardiales bacterium]
MSEPTPDTADLRAGAPIHDNLLALLPLVGVWRGAGSGVVASSGAQFAYGQQISFVHDGRPFLAYESRTWLRDAGGGVIRQAWRESGFWRPGAGPDDIEVVLAANTGQALLFTGQAAALRWELATTAAVPAPTAKPVDGERRLYALLDGELVYASELAPAGQPYAAHLNARLART